MAVYDDQMQLNWVVCFKIGRKRQKSKHYLS